MKVSRQLSLVALAAMLALGACKKEKSSQSEPGDKPVAQAGGGGSAQNLLSKGDTSKLVDPPFFKNIPASSPFVMASFDPLPRDFVERLATLMKPAFALAKRELTAEAQTDDDAALILSELSDKLTWDGLERIGISPSPRFAAYMIDVSFAFRVELSDGGKLRSYLRELEAKSGDPLPPTEKLGDVEYWRWTEGQALFAAAITKNEFIFGIMLESASASILPVLLGQKLPSPSIADSGALRQIVADYGVGGLGVGYFDSHALLSLLTRAPIGVQGTPFDLTQYSPQCVAEFTQLADLIPRIAFGYTELSGKRAAWLAVAELRKDVSGGLREVVKPAPGLGTLTKNRPLFAIGIGGDIVKLMFWMQKQADAVVSQPYMCDSLAGLNKAASDISGGAKQALAAMPTVLKQINGGAMALQEMQVSGLPMVKALAMLVADEPTKVLSFLQENVPGFPAIAVEPNGKPVKVDIPMPIPGDLHVAVSGQVAALSMGPDMVDRLPMVVESPVPADGPFAYFAYDYTKFAQSPMFNSGMDDDEEYESPEEEQMVRQMTSQFGWNELQFYLEGPGVVMKHAMEFQ